MLLRNTAIHSSPNPNSSPQCTLSASFRDTYKKEEQDNEKSIGKKRMSNRKLRKYK